MLRGPAKPYSMQACGKLWRGEEICIEMLSLKISLYFWTNCPSSRKSKGRIEDSVYGKRRSAICRRHYAKHSRCYNTARKRIPQAEVIDIANKKGVVGMAGQERKALLNDADPQETLTKDFVYG